MTFSRISPGVAPGKELLGREHLVEDGTQAEDVAPVIGPQLDHHLRRHVGRLAGDGVVAGAAPRGDAEVDELHRPLARHHDVAGADVAVDDVGPLVDVLKGPADAARDEHRQVDVGDALHLAVTVEVLDERPAVDVLEDDAELAADVVEIEDPSDVLVIEDRVPARLVHEELDVVRILGLQLLDDDGALEAGLATSRPL
jgi:hypothetical protein